MGAVYVYGSGSRRIPVATRRIPGTCRLPRVQSPYRAHTRQGGPHGDGQRTVRVEGQTRDDAAQLFSELGISTTQAISMFLKQAVREQRMPFEVTARPTIEYGSESMGK